MTSNALIFRLCKEAAGRPKDREALAELRVLLEEQKRMRR